MTSDVASQNGKMTDTPAQTVRVGVVGCGRWGKNLARNFHHLGALAALCDLDGEILAPLREEYKGLKITSQYTDLLKAPDLDAVVIATPSVTHYKLAKAAFLAGKHVYVEKPIATSSAEVLELETLSETCDRVLMVGHLLLYHPVVRRLKQLIEAGELGELKYIQSDRLNFNPYRPDKSVVWDLAPHDLSMLTYLVGAEPVRVISASGHRTAPDGLVDVAHIELQFPGDVKGHIHTSWIHPTKQVRLVVRGTHRTAVLDDTLGENKLQIFKSDDETRPVEELPDYLTIEPLKLECQHFLSTVRGEHPPRTGSVDGYHVVRVLEQVEAML